MRVRVLRSPQCVALIGRAPGRRSWRLRVRVPSQSATCSRAKAAKANRWGLISPVDSRNCFRQGYSSAAIRSMRTNGTCGCDSHCPAYGLLATTGRAPVLQAGGYGFESRTVHGCSRKRCSYLAARCPPGLPSFTQREAITLSARLAGRVGVKRIWRNLADALDLGSSAFGRVGSSPTMRTVAIGDPPKPGSVRLPGHQGTLLLQWFWTSAWGELNDVSTHPRAPPHNGEGPRPSFLFSGWGPFVMPGGVSCNQTPVAQCRALRWVVSRFSFGLL